MSKKSKRRDNEAPEEKATEVAETSKDADPSRRYVEEHQAELATDTPPATDEDKQLSDEEVSAIWGGAEADRLEREGDNYAQGTGPVEVTAEGLPSPEDAHEYLPDEGVLGDPYTVGIADDHSGETQTQRDQRMRLEAIKRADAEKLAEYRKSRKGKEPKA